MTTQILRSFIIITLFCAISAQANAQKKKYKVVQGISYLHTQVKLIIDNWGVHPLSEKPIDEFAKEYQKHFVEEFEHDEEWVEYMLEKNLLDGFDSLDSEVTEAIQANLVFYQNVYALVKTPREFTKQLKKLNKELGKADNRLYQTIFPALIH